MMRFTTPRPWPEGTVPTAEHLAKWLMVCTDGERVYVIERMQANGDAANRCFMEDHDALKDENTRLRQEIVRLRGQLENAVGRYVGVTQ
jgi:hypothetical protein